MGMRSTIRTTHAPQPVAAYEQAIATEGLIFVSGQVGADPLTGSINSTSFESEVVQTLSNVEAIVAAAGGTRSDIVRCGVFLADIKDFAAMNRVYADFFGDTLPARTTVQVVLGMARVEIDAVAVRRKKPRKPKDD